MENVIESLIAAVKEQEEKVLEASHELNSASQTLAMLKAELQLYLETL